MSEVMKVAHEFGPFYDKDSKVLILGSIPSPKSREQGFYYGHPRNRFWPVLAALFGERIPQTVPERKDFLTRHNIALWDVLASCDIKGADDGSIRNPEANDMRLITESADIRAIFTLPVEKPRNFMKRCVNRYAASVLRVCHLQVRRTADAPWINLLKNTRKY